MEQPLSNLPAKYRFDVRPTSYGCMVVLEHEYSTGMWHELDRIEVGSVAEAEAAASELSGRVGFVMSVETHLKQLGHPLR